MQLSSGQNCYLLPADEIQKMLQQNANIIRKFITDVNNGSCLLFWLSPTELIDVTEYSGLHTSVYLLSLFTKSKDGTASKTSVPVSTYQNLIKKMKQVEFQAQQQQQQQQWNYDDMFGNRSGMSRQEAYKVLGLQWLHRGVTHV